MPGEVLVRQYPRGLRIVLELDYVLMPVIRSHQLGLRATAEATDMLNCLDVHCDFRCDGEVRKRSGHLLQATREWMEKPGAVAMLRLCCMGRRGIGELFESEHHVA